MEFRYTYTFPKVPGHPHGLHSCVRYEGNWYWEGQLYVQLTKKAIVILTCPNADNKKEEVENVQTLWEVPLDGSAESDEIILSLFPDSRIPIENTKDPITKENLEQSKLEDKPQSADNEYLYSKELFLRDILRPFLVCLFRVDTYEFRNQLADRVREKVLASPMLLGIYRKENYLWLREQYEQSTRKEYLKNELEIAFWRRYGAAEREWFSFCSNKFYDHLFGRSGWFGYVESEVRTICHFDYFPFLLRNKDYTIKNNSCSLPYEVKPSSCCHILPFRLRSRHRRNQLTAATYRRTPCLHLQNRSSTTQPKSDSFSRMTCFHLYRLRKLTALPEFVLNQNNRDFEKPSVVSEIVFVDQMQTAMVRWFLGRYDLSSVFVMLFIKTLCLVGYVLRRKGQKTNNIANLKLGFKGTLVLLWYSLFDFTVFIFAFLIVIISIFYLVKILLPFPCIGQVLCTSIKISFALAFVFLACVFFTSCWIFSNKKPKALSENRCGSIVFRFILYRPICIYLWGILISIILSIIVVHYTPIRWQSYFLRLPIYIFLCGPICIVLISVANLTFWFLAEKRLSKGSNMQYPRGNQALLGIQACLPRLMLGMIGGWIVLIGTGGHWRPFIFHDFYDLVTLNIPLLILIVILTMVEINNNISKIFRSLCRSLTLVFVTFLLSCVVGVVAFCVSLEDSIYFDELFMPIKNEEKISGNLNHAKLSPRLERLLKSKGIIENEKTEYKFPPDIDQKALWTMLTVLYWSASDNSMRIKEYIKELSIMSKDDMTKIKKLTDMRNEFQSRMPHSTGCLSVQYAYHLKYNRPNGEKDIFLIPGLILQFSTLAVFIAIALQLIFEDKRITEPI